MESNLNENFDLTSKNPTDEALQREPTDEDKIEVFLKRQRSIRSQLSLDKLCHIKPYNLMAEHWDLRERLQEDEKARRDKKDKGGGGKGGGGSDKKDKGGGGKGGGGSDKKDKPDDSEKKDKEGGGRAGEKKDKTSGELRKMGANKVYGGWFQFGPGKCAEAVVDKPKQEEWLLTVVH